MRMLWEFWGSAVVSIYGLEEYTGAHEYMKGTWAKGVRRFARGYRSYIRALGIPEKSL